MTSIKDVKIEKGDWFQKQYAPEGEPYQIVVIKKDIITELQSCLDEYAEYSHGFDKEECQQEIDENLIWILGIVADATRNDNRGVKCYLIDEFENKQKSIEQSY